MSPIQNNCLLTIVVVTYNSSEFIRDTLLSISMQHSKDIQIILTDDCSGDNTYEMLFEWQKVNNDLFLEIILLDSKENLGIVQNFTKTFKYAKGIWLKAIAGDDKFDLNAVEFIRKDVELYSNSSVIVGKAEIFGDNISNRIIIPRIEIISKLNTINKTKNYLFEGYTFPGVSFLIRTQILKENNLFKHAKKNLEDIPFQLELLFMGFKFEQSDHTYIHYRKHDANLSNLNDGILAKNFVDYQKILFIYSLKGFKINYAINSTWNVFWGLLIFIFGNEGKICKFLNDFRKSLQPKRFFKLFGKPF
jgi:glycosyltransferase involved in cell wall biosynthesis